MRKRKDNPFAGKQLPACLLSGAKKIEYIYRIQFILKKTLSAGSLLGDVINTFLKK
jgi:hypothetical protein